MEKNSNESIKLQFSDYLILLLIGLFYYVDFIPSFRAIEVRGTQFLYMSVLNLIIGISFFVFPKFLHTSVLDILKKSLFTKVYVSFLIICCISVISAQNFSIWIVSFSQLLILSVTIFNFCVLLYDKKYLFYHICFLIGVFTFVKVVSELNYLIQQTKTTSLNQAIGLLKGNTGNINIFSATLNVKLPFLILGILYFKTYKRWLLIISVFLSVIVIFLLDSRATFLALIIMLLTSVLFFFWKSKDKKNIQTNILLSCLPIIFGVLLGYFVITNSKTIIKTKANFELNNKGEVVILNDASTNSRLNYWKNATKIIQNKPILGVGLGNWIIESIPYEKLQADNLLVSIHTHNDFLQITSETGVLNGLLFLGLFVILFLINIKKIFKTHDQLTQNIAFFCLLILIGYGVDSFFNFPLLRPTMQLGLCFLIVFSLLNIDKNENEIVVFKWDKILLSIVVLINLTTVFFSYHNFMSLRLSNELFIDKIEDNQKLTSDFIIENLPKYPNVLFNSQPFVEYVGMYLTDEKKFDLAKKYFNEAYKINPHVGRVEWYKYSIARQTNKPDSAYIYAKQAFEKRPRNVDYFNTLIFIANEFKDTIEIVKTHNRYHNYVKNSKNYIETSSALHNSNMNKKSLVKFINIGLKEFPNDSLLLRRKKIFEYEQLTRTNNTAVLAAPITTLVNENNFEKVLKKAEEAGAKYLKEATELGLEEKFEQSIAVYKKVLETQPSNIGVKQNIGISYFKLNKFEKAIEWLQLSTAKAGGLTDGKSEYVIAACYLSLKNTSKCCEYLDIAVAQNYTNALALQQVHCKK